MNKRIRNKHRKRTQHLRPVIFHGLKPDTRYRIYIMNGTRIQSYGALKTADTSLVVMVPYLKHKGSVRIEEAVLAGEWT